MRTNENHDSVNPTQFLHSRYEDGDHRIEVTPIGYLVLDTGALYTSGRSLLQSLTKHPRARNWTLDRYFRLDRPKPQTLPGAGILDIFGHTPQPVGSTGLTLDRQGVVRLSEGLTIAGPRRLGIDLENRSHEVQKLLFAGFGSKIFSAGYDPDDVLQDVYKGILTRNNGICAWDAGKSSFGHYVHMVCGCVLHNFHRREQRRRYIEQIGLTVASGDRGARFKEVDVGDALAGQLTATFWGTPKQDVPSWALDDLGAHLRAVAGRRRQAVAGLAVRLIPLARRGMSRAEMSAVLGESKAHISRAMAYLKAEALEWARP